MGTAQPAPGPAPAGPGRLRSGRPAGAQLAAATLLSLTLALLAACAVLLWLTRAYGQAGYGAGGVVSALAAAAVGAVVVRRQAANPIGWLLLGWGLVIPVVGTAQLYAVLDYRLRGGTLPGGRIAVFAEATEFLVATASGLAVLLFPDGTLPSRRWRGVLVGFLGAAAVYLAHLLADQARAAGLRSLRVGPAGNPLTGAPLAAPASAPVLLAQLGRAAGWLILACWLLFLGRQAVSYRHACGDRRQQLKWLLAGGASCVVATTVTIFAGNYSSGLARAVQDAADLGAAALPVGIGIGILRYHLYDIDRIISRTLAYTIVTGLLLGVYAALVLPAGLVLPRSSPVAVAGATLVVAGLFHPLRRRVQRAVDRRFNRARYDADRMVAVFAARLTGAMDLDAVRADLAEAVQQALEPAHVSVWTPPPQQRQAGYVRDGTSAPHW